MQEEVTLEIKDQFGSHRSASFEINLQESHVHSFMLLEKQFHASLPFNETAVRYTKHVHKQLVRQDSDK